MKTILNLEEIKELKKEIKQGINYKDLAQKYGVCTGIISLANKGEIWAEEGETFPLIVKGSSKLRNAITWVLLIKKDLKESTLTPQQIANKYKKALSTIKKINCGMSYREKNTKYPLTSYRKK